MSISRHKNQNIEHQISKVSWVGQYVQTNALSQMAVTLQLRYVFLSSQITRVEVLHMDALLLHCFTWYEIYLGYLLPIHISKWTVGVIHADEPFQRCRHVPGGRFTKGFWTVRENQSVASWWSLRSRSETLIHVPNISWVMGTFLLPYSQIWGAL